MSRRSLSSSLRSLGVSLRERETLDALDTFEDLGCCDGDGAPLRKRLGEEMLVAK